MKTVLALILVMSVSVLADYTYTYTAGMDFGDLSLNDSQSIRVDGGEGHHLNLLYYSSARIDDTSPLISEGNGGIWQIMMGGYSEITIKDGAIHRLSIGSYATAQINGGWIEQIYSSQNAIYEKHIEIICRDWEYSTASKILTGTWEDYSAFNIQLIDVSGTSPTIDNIKFTIVPEPASMLLIGLGGFFLRQRRK
jgi:hypothetical protein